jgi:ABC-2 type transport system permease protein
MATTFIHPLTGFVDKTFVITEFELRKLRHDFTELVTRALQPTLWLLIFGQVFARSGAIRTGNIPYLDFIAPGILAQSVLFVAIFYGINVIWERDLGIVQKFLASPTPRAALVLGKGLSAGIRTLSQAAVVYGLSLLLGVKLNWSPLALLNVVIVVVLAATLFSTFSLIIACIVKTRERFMGVGQVLTMPRFFASNAIYPTAIMPGWPEQHRLGLRRRPIVSSSRDVKGARTPYQMMHIPTLFTSIRPARPSPPVALTRTAVMTGLKCGAWDRWSVASNPAR